MLIKIVDDVKASSEVGMAEEGNKRVVGVLIHVEVLGSAEKEKINEDQKGGDPKEAKREHIGERFYGGDVARDMRCIILANTRNSKGFSIRSVIVFPALNCMKTQDMQLSKEPRGVVIN